MSKPRNHIKYLKGDRSKCHAAFIPLLLVIFAMILFFFGFSISGFMGFLNGISESIEEQQIGNYTHLVIKMSQSSTLLFSFSLLRKFESVLKDYLLELKKFRDELRD